MSHQKAAIVITLQHPLIPPYFPDTPEGQTLPPQLNQLLNEHPGFEHKAWDYSTAINLNVIKLNVKFLSQESMLSFVHENRAFLHQLYSAAENHYRSQNRSFQLQLMSNNVFELVDLSKGEDAFLIPAEAFQPGSF